jgi:hypothetical protein
VVCVAVMYRSVYVLQCRRAPYDKLVMKMRLEIHLYDLFNDNTESASLFGTHGAKLSGSAGVATATATAPLQ